jgi:hypothetical protein
MPTHYLIPKGFASQKSFILYVLKSILNEELDSAIFYTKVKEEIKAGNSAFIAQTNMYFNSLFNDFSCQKIALILAESPIIQTWQTSYLEKTINKPQDIFKIVAEYWQKETGGLSPYLKGNLRKAFESFDVETLSQADKFYKKGEKKITWELVLENIYSEAKNEDKQLIVSDLYCWKASIKEIKQDFSTFSKNQTALNSTWKKTLKNNYISYHDLLDNLNLILEQSPTFLSRALSMINNEDTIQENTISPFLFHTKLYEIQAVFAKKIDKLYDTERYIEQIISVQEREIQFTHLKALSLFDKLEDDFFFETYHELNTIFNKLIRLRKKYFAKLNRTSILKSGEAMQEVLKKGQVLLEEFETLKSKHRDKCEQELEIDFLWKKTEDRSIEKLQEEVMLIAEMQSFYYSAQNKGQVSEQELKNVIRLLDELENVVLYKVRGRISAFKDIQKVYFAKLKPKLIDALDKMCEITEGVANKFLDKLRKAQNYHQEKVKNWKSPDSKVAENFNQILEDTLEDDRKKARNKGLNLEDFKATYFDKIRVRYIKESESISYQELKDFRTDIQGIFNSAKKEMSHILEFSRSLMSEMMAEARLSMQTAYRESQDEQVEMQPFFSEIRKTVRNIFRDDQVEKTFLFSIYPSFTRTKEIRHCLETAMDTALQNLPTLEGKTLIWIHHSSIVDIKKAEQVAFQLAVLLKRGEDTDLLLGSHFIEIQSQENLNVLKNKLISWFMSFSNKPLAWQQLEQRTEVYDRLIVFKEEELDKKQIYQLIDNHNEEQNTLKYFIDPTQHVNFYSMSHSIHYFQQFDEKTLLAMQILEQNKLELIDEIRQIEL